MLKLNSSSFQPSNTDSLSHHHWTADTEFYYRISKILHCNAGRALPFSYCTFLLSVLSSVHITRQIRRSQPSHHRMQIKNSSVRSTECSSTFHRGATYNPSTFNPCHLIPPTSPLAQQARMQPCSICRAS